MKFFARLGLSFLFSFPTLFSQYDSAFFFGMKARSIGPAGMSGRIGAIDAVQSDPNIVYVGGASGGVWKSTNAGVSWTPIFDEQNVSSIGAIAVDQRNPNVVWVGTGESAVRNSVGVGRGIFRTLDAGKTWSLLGLERSEKISKIILHPTDPNVIFVGVLGATWGDSKERGLYQSTDGGKTWNLILSVNEKTGVADMAMDPGNPNKLIVSMWEHRRWPWFFKSGGPGSGIYMTSDGGANWKKLSNKDGLPDGELGRAGIAFASNKPNVVYILLEATKNVLLRSDDGGYKWRTINQQENVNYRPFYFCHIAVNPKNENILYRLSFELDASEDGGKTFASTTPWAVVHPDWHAIWVHQGGEMIIAGNDGGIAISNDRAKTWRFVQNLPLAQFYHVGYDMQFPYNIYGGMQDNGSWRGPSNSFKKDGIYNHEWEMVAFGDGFDTQPDPENNDGGYAMSQAGELYYYDHKLGTRKSIQPTEADVKERYNWNSGFAIDPFNPKTIYYGSQFLHKSADKGQTWEIISPDLTTSDSTKLKQKESGGLTHDATGAENHCTIIAVAPSPLKQGVIWVGTDDGNIQLTTDGGRSWSLLSKNKSITAPAATWIPHIEASKHDPAAAYVCMDDHRRSNWQSYIFVTRDYGKTWQNLANKEIDGFVHVIEEDPVNKNLLFAGTEFGLFVSLNGGKNWIAWKNGVPTAPVLDLAVHPRENDLIVATHGRATFVLDDVSPLRTVSEQAAKQKAYIFEIPDAYQYHSEYWAGPYTSSGDAMYKGTQRDYGALISYTMTIPDSLRKLEDTPDEKKVKIEILQGDKIIRTLKGSARRGINRAAWDLTMGQFHSPNSVDSTDIEKSGIFVLPGNYTARIRYDSLIFARPLVVKPDPRTSYDENGRRASQELMVKTGALLETVAKIYKQIDITKKAIKTVGDNLTNLDTAKSNRLKTAGTDLEKKLNAMQQRIQPKSESQGLNDFEESIAADINTLLYRIGSTYGGPTQATIKKNSDLQRIVSGVVKDYQALYETDVAGYQKTVSESGFTLFKAYDKIEGK